MEITDLHDVLGKTEAEVAALNANGLVQHFRLRSVAVQYQTRHKFSPQISQMHTDKARQSTRRLMSTRAPKLISSPIVFSART